MIQAEDLNRCTKGMTDEPWKQEMEREDLRCEDGPPSLASLMEEIDSKAAVQRNSSTENVSLPPSLLIRLIDSTKNTFLKIRQIHHDSVEKMDLESRKSLEKTMNQEIKKFDSVLNQILNYISVSTPVIKTNTILTILEEILEAKGEELHHKGITISKKYEKNLPETCIHDEQVKFILNSIVQYAILSSPLDGRIRLFTRSVHIHHANGDEKVTPIKEKEKAHVEIMVVMMDGTRSIRKLEATKVPVIGEGTSKIILFLVKDLIQRYKGLVEFEIVEKDDLTVIGVRLPICRNQVVAYEPIQM